MKPLVSSLIVMLSLTFSPWLGAQEPAATAEAESETKAEKPLAPYPRVKLQTNHGDIVLRLDREKAPKTVANFLDYVNGGFYDQTLFHRVIKGFMIQGGGFNMGMQRKETLDPIPNEAANGLRNQRGTVAMARTSAPHSATAQFFINLVDNHFLNYRGPTPKGWGYAVFGKVISGMDVVDRIANLRTGAAGPFRKDAPQSPVIIQKAFVLSQE